MPTDYPPNPRKQYRLPPAANVLIVNPNAIPPPGHWSVIENLFLTSTVAPDGLADLLAGAPNLRHLSVSSSALLTSGALAGLTLPSVQQLTLQQLSHKRTPRWQDLHGLTGLTRLKLHGKASAELFDALARAPWWPALTHLDLCCTELQRADSQWPHLWLTQQMQLRWLRLCHLQPVQVRAVLAAQLPQLTTLVWRACQLDRSALQQLAQAPWPALAELDLHGNPLAIEDFAAFIATHRLPSLARIGASFYSAHLQTDYTDWNGAVVGHGSVPLTEQEIRDAAFGESGLEWLEPLQGW